MEFYNNCGCCDCGCHGHRCPPGPPGPRGPRGPQGIQGPPGETITTFGGKYHSTTQLVFFTAADTPVQIKFDTDMPSDNVSYGTNTIIIQQAGVYEVTYNLLMSATQKIDVTSVVRKNNNAIAQTNGSHTLYINSTGSNTTDARLLASTFVELAEGDILDLTVSVLRTLPSGLTVAINGEGNATLTVKLLGTE